MMRLESFACQMAPKCPHWHPVERPCKRQSAFSLLPVRQESRPTRSCLACRRPLLRTPHGPATATVSRSFQPCWPIHGQPRPGSRPTRALQRDSAFFSSQRLALILALGAGGPHPLPSAQPTGTQRAGERVGCFPPPTEQ